MSDPLFFLYQEDYGIYSRSMAKKLNSLNASVFLSELAQRRNYHTIRDELISNEKHGNGWFYLTVDKMTERTSLSGREQETAIEILLKFGLIQRVNFGLPNMRHFRLNDEKILEAYKLSKIVSNSAESAELDVRKAQNHVCGKSGTAHIDKEPKEEKKNNNPPVGVVVSSHLDKLDIEASLRWKISAEYTPEQIEKAVDRCLAWKSRNSDQQGVMTALARADTWIDNPTKEDLQQLNKDFLDKLRILDGKTLALTTVSVGIDYIEFIAGMKVVVFGIGENEFKTKVKDYLKYLDEEAKKMRT